MSDQDEIIAALEARLAAHDARMAELERRLVASEGGRRAGIPRLARRVAALGLVVMMVAVPGVVLASDRFSDVPNGHPFHNDIDWLADYGIANGFNDGTYRPGQAVTRQAMAAFLHRLSNDFEVVGDGWDPPGSTEHFGTATCPGDKRAVAGGGSTSSVNLFMTDSYPFGTSWYVRWQTHNNATADPTNVTVFALCVPRL